MTSGLDLKAQRKRALVRTQELADRMGIGRTRIPQIEALAAVSEEMVSRYLAALVDVASERRQP